jgi:hypothetical protein
MIIVGSAMSLSLVLALLFLWQYAQACAGHSSVATIRDERVPAGDLHTCTAR